MSESLSIREFVCQSLCQIKILSINSLEAVSLFVSVLVCQTVCRFLCMSLSFFVIVLECHNLCIALYLSSIVYLSVPLSISVHYCLCPPLSACASVYQGLCLSVLWLLVPLSTCASVHQCSLLPLSTPLSTCASVYQGLCISVLWLLVPLSTCASVYQGLCLSVLLTISASVYMSIRIVCPALLPRSLAILLFNCLVVCLSGCPVMSVFW